MSARSCLPFALGLAVCLGAGTAAAQSCKPEEAWSHEHADTESHTMTTDIKGSRNTRIEICRAADPSGDKLDVEVSFANSHKARELVAGDCVDKFAAWAVVRSKGAKAESGPAKALGTYKICKEK